MFIVNIARVKQGPAVELVPQGKEKIEGSSRGDVEWTIAPIRPEYKIAGWKAVLLEVKKETAQRRLREDPENPGHYAPVPVKKTTTEEVIVFVPQDDNDPVLLVGKTQTAQEAIGALRLYKPHIELKRVRFDIQRINSQHSSDAWMLAFSKDGHVKAGVLYGNAIMKDPLVGGGSLQTFANQAGIELPLPGEQTKVRVLRDGGVQLYHTDSYGLLQDKEALTKTIYIAKNLLAFEDH